MNRKKKTNRRRSKTVIPRTAKQFLAMRPAFQDRWIRVTQTITEMRSNNVSLKEASHEFGLDPRVVTSLGKSALRKRRNGQYVARRTDNLLRVLPIPSPEEKGGRREIATWDSREATLIGKYWAALQKYVQTGDSSALKRLRRKNIIDASGKQIPLLTDLAELDRLGSAGALSFESLYAEVG